tara:strand:- start:71 stop:466 length:396 start_codon:yes stop_codon:yes gene_type:complete
MADKNKKQKKVWKISDPSDFKKEQDKIHAAQDDKLKYQRIYKDASASPAEQREEKARSRIKATRGSGRMAVGKSVKGEAEKTLKNYKERIAKDYFNSKNKSKMQMPKMGVNPDAFSKHGGAGPRGKFLKRT